MSESTKAAIDEAIRAHMDDEAEGSFLTDWVIMAAGAVPESADRTRYLAEFSDSPQHTLSGLATLLGQELANQYNAGGEDE